MLEEKDIQAIRTLLDQKLEENNQLLKAEIFGEMDRRFNEVLSVMNETFYNHENRFDKIENRLDKLNEEV